MSSAIQRLSLFNRKKVLTEDNPLPILDQNQPSSFPTPSDADGKDLEKDTPADVNEGEDGKSSELQNGVQKVEAITANWSKTSLIAVYIW